MNGVYVLGLILAIVMLCVCAMKNINIYITAIFCSMIIVVTNGMSMYETITETYVAGFTGFITNYFLMFSAGALFGKIMEITGGARAIAKLLVRFTGEKSAYFAIPIILGVMSYGGINGYVAKFAVISIALQLFREADIPRRLLPCWLLFGTGEFSNAAPGAPSLMNIVATETLGQPLMAAPVVGFISSAVVLFLGLFVFSRIVKRLKANGEHFIVRDTDVFSTDDSNLPNGILAMLPLIITIMALNIPVNGKMLPVLVGLLIGCISAIVLMYKYIDFKELPNNIGKAFESGIGMITVTGAVVGFGTVMSASPAFEVVKNTALTMPGPAALSLALATGIITFAAGSGTAGASVVTPALGAAYVAKGLSPALVSRTICMSGIAFDSSPFNGGVYAAIVGICGEKIKDAYPFVFIMNIAVPFVGLIVCLALTLIMG